MKQKIFVGILASFLLVTMLSGCLGSGSDDDRFVVGPGIIITDFRSDFPSIDASEDMFLSVDFENRGDFPARDVEGTLIRKGAFTIPDAASVYDKSVAALEKPLGDVYSSDEFYWKIRAPGVTQDRTEEVQARVYYNYTTEGYATIHFVPREILREKGIDSFQLDPSTTNGPIEIDIVANQPVIIQSLNETKKAVRITFLLSNVWNGRAEAKSAVGTCNTALDCIDKLTIEGLGATCKIEKDLGGGTGMEQVLSESTDGIKMIQGEEGRFSDSYTFIINDPNAQTSCQIKATATYRYRVDSDVLPIDIIALQ